MIQEVGQIKKEIRRLFSEQHSLVPVLLLHNLTETGNIP